MREGGRSRSDRDAQNQTGGKALAHAWSIRASQPHPPSLERVVQQRQAERPTSSMLIFGLGLLLACGEDRAAANFSLRHRWSVQVPRRRASRGRALGMRDGGQHRCWATVDLSPTVLGGIGYVTREREARAHQARSNLGSTERSSVRNLARVRFPSSVTSGGGRSTLGVFRPACGTERLPGQFAFPKRFQIRASWFFCKVASQEKGPVSRAFLCGACRDRTGDLRLAKPALSQLS
jgi:hypothetical protein